MNLRCFNLRLLLCAAVVAASATPLLAQAFDSQEPAFTSPSLTGPNLNGPSTAPPPAASHTFVSPTSAPPPLESEPPFSAPSPMTSGSPGPGGSSFGPPAPDPAFGPPGNSSFGAPAGSPFGPPGGPPYGPPGGPPYGPPAGPPPYYPAPRSYVPPVYVPPPTGPLVIPEISALETRFWLRSEYIAWWTKDAPLATPLVTTGSPGDSVPAALGQPNTQVLYGGGNVFMGVASGWRLDTGMWLDHNQRFGLQTVFFILQRQDSGFDAYSDGNGYPVIGRPANLAGGGQTAYLDSAPGNLAGGNSVTNTSQFFGYEFNGLMKILQTEHFRIDGILGFRYLNLHESTEIDDELYPLSSGALTFLGQPVSTSSTMFDFDRFETTNNFFGGQLGTRMEWSWGRWSADLTTKVALGTTQEKSIISGGTTVFPASGPGTSAEGGVLATSANIGEYYQSPFAVVPELDLNLAFAITPHLTARVGYTFIYWSNVLRPGDQINSTVSPNLIPSDPSYGTGGPNQPQYQASTTSYWAQGLNLGLDFHF